MVESAIPLRFCTFCKFWVLGRAWFQWPGFKKITKTFQNPQNFTEIIATNDWNGSYYAINCCILPNTMKINPKSSPRSVFKKFYSLYKFHSLFFPHTVTNSLKYTGLRDLTRKTQNLQNMNSRLHHLARRFHCPLANYDSCLALSTVIGSNIVKAYDSKC